jgi:hypothetical protein
MNLYNESNIEFFKFFFTSIYKYADQEKFKNTNYQDLQNFVDTWLKKDEKEAEIIAQIFLEKCILIRTHKDAQFISFEDHKNLIKITEYLEEKIDPKIKVPICLGVNYDLKQFVWLFKILQENNVIQNNKSELINILQVILSAEIDGKNNIERYMYANNFEEPKKCIFPKLDWDDLSK